MELWAYPYLFWYVSLFAFWMLGAHRQILFWLYLWQLKEYHWGRFWAHFQTAQGKSLFLNPLFLAKVASLVLGIVYFVKTGKILLPLAIIFALFLTQALWLLWSIVRKNLLHPTVTKKSLMVLAAAHFAVFAAGFAVFSSFLGEMNLREFTLAAFALLAIDIFLPAIVGLVVLALQPLTIWEKNKILARAAAIINDRQNLTTIAIAGSYGKTATKELLAHILAKKFKVLKTQANQNTEIGVAQTIINDLKPEHQIFVCEIGAVHLGRIKQVVKIVKPKIGILTGINQQHLGVFGSQQNIIDGKFEIMEVLPENGTAILNWNSPLLAQNFEAQKKRIEAKDIVMAGKDIKAENEKATIDRLLLTIDHRNEKIQLDTNARGAFMVEPILLAAAGALAAGMELAEIADVLNKTDFTPFNLKKISGSQTSTNLNVLDSTYSANPDGVIGHLDYLKLWPGKKAIIMPCLIELGKSSKEVHRQIGQKIAHVCDFAIITTEDYFVDLKNAAIAAGMNPENIILSSKPTTINDLMKNRLAGGDTVLLEGRLSKEITNCLK